MLPPPHKKHFCGKLLLEDWKRSEKDRRVYLLHSLRLNLFFLFAPLDPCPALGKLLQTDPCHIRWKEYECSRNKTHSNPQPSTVMLRQPVLVRLHPVTPALVTTGTRITPLTMLPSLHHWAVLPIEQHYKNLHIQTQQLASYYSATLSYASFPSPSTCMYKASSSTFIIHIWMQPVVWIKSPLNGSYWIQRRHVTSGCLVLPLKHHVIFSMEPLNTTEQPP